jgi:hypothetical protein
LETLARLQVEQHQLEAVPGLEEAQAQSLRTMYLCTLSELDAWIDRDHLRQIHTPQDPACPATEGGRWGRI